MQQNYLNKFTSYLSVIAIVFFSYIPFLYLFSIINIEKYLIFLLLISAILILALFSLSGQMLRGKIKFYKRNITAFSLYMLTRTTEAYDAFMKLKNACKAVGGTFTLLWHNTWFTTDQECDLYEAVIKG